MGRGDGMCLLWKGSLELGLGCSSMVSGTEVSSTEGSNKVLCHCHTIKATTTIKYSLLLLTITITITHYYD